MTVSTRQPIPFTDTDLKRLKELSERLDAIGEEETMLFIKTELKPLLVRLEAAERVLNLIAQSSDLKKGSMYWFHEEDRLFKDWRKTSGK